MKILSRLDWPLGRPITHKPKRSRFDSHSLSKCIDELGLELKRLRAEDVVLTANWEVSAHTRRPNVAQPRSRVEHFGVSVFWRRAARSYQLACDTYSSWEDNLWALARHIEAVRTQERYGVATLEEAFKGAELALPAAPQHRAPHEVLGLTQQQARDRANVDACYRTLAREHHPDAGGSADQMAALTSARDQLYRLNNW